MLSDVSSIFVVNRKVATGVVWIQLLLVEWRR